ncbi:MAG: putative ABC exporter domain-containing protein [Clostridium sp.]|nr:putative ABC exporter domain-containing protein [Clostridium sp.]MCI7441910.1 putative ABC exporter domain-containing protein [Clostridium sp.]
MRPFIYLARRTFINYIKSFKHKPSKAIPLIFYGLMILFIFLNIEVVENENINNEYIKSKYFIFGATIILLILTLYNLYSGISRKNFRYTMSDVNIIFTAPIKPQNVLLYGFIREISFILVFSFVFIYQIPNMAMNFNFQESGITLFLIGVLLFLITITFISLLMYGIFSKFYMYKERAKKIAKIVILLIIVVLALNIYLKSNGEYFDYTVELFNKDFWRYIPILGWMREITIQALNGISKSIYLYMALLFGATILCGIILYNLKLDFYEDALPSAEQNEVAQSYKNSGYDKKQLNNMQVKARKPLFARKTKEFKYSATYAKAIFFRHLLEYRKTGFYFLNIFSLVYLGVAIFVGYTKIPMYGLFFFSIYMMFLTTYAGKWATDFNNQIIFLIPARSEEKLFYSTLTTVIQYAVNGVILFLPSGVMSGTNIIDIILFILAYTSFGAVATYGAVLNYKLFDRVSNEMLKGIFMMITLFIYILPGIIIGLIISFVLKIFGDYSLQVAFIIYNTFASFVIIQFAKGIYDKVEI